MILTTLIDLDGTAGWVLMLAPLVVLAVVVVGVIAGRDRAARDPLPAEVHRAPAAMSEAPPPADATVAGLGAHDRASPAHDTGAQIAAPGTGSTPANAQPVPAPPSQMPSQVSGDADHQPWDTADRDMAQAAGISALEAELVQAEQRFDDAAVARLSLQLACDLIARDAPRAEVQSHLRRAIILAARLKDHDTHASARLELGDLMQADGDLTSACEHWQIARQIYWDGNAKEELNEVDRRMVANGCPTDWVLNDF